MKFRYYGKKTQNRLYKLTDFYTLFYLKYIEPNIDSFDEQWWSKHYLSHSVEAWQGLTFELLCLFHISQIRKALNIGGVASEAYIWCCQWHPFKYSKQRSHTRQSLSRMTHRRKRIFSSLKKRKKVGRVFDGGISLHVRLSETEINLKIGSGLTLPPLLACVPIGRHRFMKKNAIIIKRLICYMLNINY